MRGFPDPPFADPRMPHRRAVPAARSVTVVPSRKELADPDVREALVMPAPKSPPLDLELVAEIVRRTGLACRVTAPATALRASRVGADGTSWTVTADVVTGDPTAGGDAGPLAFVGPAGSPVSRVLRAPDERRLAAVVVLQALRRSPDELLTHDEARAAGLADDIVWPLGSP
ncbi:hypothetical protein ACFQ34_06860 [Pseudonocardia benzenivorans]|uniref:Uncharacterized protein n=1 Tax=Pseudonocardia benzenivorans TaxID=228005 RepID=A0ABW3VCX3_9PSEU